MVNAFALVHFDPLWIAIARAGIGALFLTLLCWIKGYKREPGAWRILLLIALLEATLPLLLVSWGQKTTPAAFAAIITGTIPLFTLLLAPLMLKCEHWSLHKIAGVCIGFGALVYLYWPQLQHSQLTHFLGPLAILVSAMCFAPCMIIIRTLKQRNPIVLARDMLLLATIQLLIMAACVQPVLPVHVTFLSFVPLLYLGVFCGGIVYVLFMWLIANEGPTFASCSNYIVPAVGVLLSAIVWHTTFDYRLIVSLILIFIALWVCQRST